MYNFSIVRGWPWAYFPHYSTRQLAEPKVRSSIAKSIRTIEDFHWRWDFHLCKFLATRLSLMQSLALSLHIIHPYFDLYFTQYVLSLMLINFHQLVDQTGLQRFTCNAYFQLCCVIITRTLTLLDTGTAAGTTITWVLKRFLEELEHSDQTEFTASSAILAR
jgi:hypothetical protein